MPRAPLPTVDRETDEAGIKGGSSHSSKVLGGIGNNIKTLPPVSLTLVSHGVASRRSQEKSRRAFRHATSMLPSTPPPPPPAALGAVCLLCCCCEAACIELSRKRNRVTAPGTSPGGVNISSRRAITPRETSTCTIVCRRPRRRDPIRAAPRLLSVTFENALRIPGARRQTVDAPGRGLQTLEDCLLHPPCFVLFFRSSPAPPYPPTLTSLVPTHAVDHPWHHLSLRKRQPESRCPKTPPPPRWAEWPRRRSRRGWRYRLG